MIAGINNCLKTYYGQADVSFRQIATSTELYKTGTVITKFNTEEPQKIIGSSKEVFLGPKNRFRKLGISELGIHKARGKEPLVLFKTYYTNGVSHSIGFMQKTEKSQMAKFIEILKDFKASGSHPNFELIVKLLKRIH